MFGVFVVRRSLIVAGGWSFVVRCLVCAHCCEVLIYCFDCCFMIDVCC